VGALERAVDRGRRRVEHVGDLATGEAEHVTKDQHRAWPLPEVLKRRDEGELGALAPFVASLGAREAVLETHASATRDRVAVFGLRSHAAWA
jgi:hypothetical protein